ncbi:MAG: hypothetical protein RR356_08715 [Bacteroidales bacterium]
MANIIDLGYLVLPKDIYEHIDLIKSDVSAKEIDLYLDEKSVPSPPSGFTSKGFTKPITIQDFPLRGKGVFLNICGLKWQNNSTEKSLQIAMI